jgi:hypothetical protein
VTAERFTRNLTHCPLSTASAPTQSSWRAVLAQAACSCSVTPCLHAQCTEHAPPQEGCRRLWCKLSDHLEPVEYECEAGWQATAIQGYVYQEWYAPRYKSNKADYIRNLAGAACCQCAGVWGLQTCSKREIWPMGSLVLRLYSPRVCRSAAGALLARMSSSASGKDGSACII